MHGRGEKRGNGEYFSIEEDSLHSFFEDEEADSYFEHLLLERKTKRHEMIKREKEYHIACYIDYIFRK
jgi:hypothetical protein